MDFIWNKPVVVFYRERFEKPERKAFLVVKSKRLVIFTVEEERAKFRGISKISFPSWVTSTTSLRSKERPIDTSYAGLRTRKMTSAKLGDD